MTITYIRWKDAWCEEAADAAVPVTPSLCELHEVGFILGEDEDVVTIGMEQHESEGVKPSRWRLHIPKVNIVERRDVPLDKAFPVRPARKGSKK